MDQKPSAKGQDRSGLLIMGVILALMLAYHYLYYLPQKQAYEEFLAQQETAQVDSSTVATPGSGSVADLGSAVAGAGSGSGSGSVAEPFQPDVVPAEHKDEIPFETGEHAMRLSTSGASLSHLTLKNVLESTYAADQSAEDDAREPQPFALHHPYLDERRSFALVPQDPALADIATRDWRHEPLDGGGHRFVLELPDRSLRLIKTYRPPRDTGGEDARVFHFDLTVAVQNTGTQPAKFGYHMLGPVGMVDQEAGRASYGQESVIALREDQRVRVEMETVTGFEEIGSPDESYAGEIPYFGLATKYFASVVIPREKIVVEADAQGLVQSTGRQPLDTDRDAPDGIGRQGLVRGLIQEFDIAPGATETQEFWVYIGPRQESDVFDQELYAGIGLDALVYFGWKLFGSMGRVLLWVLLGLYGLIGNWGFAILALTFLVRGVMTPLSMWSQKNMLRMQKLAPEINKLKEKYSRKDGSMTPEQQRQFQQAQMELWRKHGVNPIGCVGPIFLQMPIFIGLYNALNYSSQLRHSEFLFWISDLSTPDVLFRLPFTIPVLGTNALSVLPLLMVGTYLAQQKLQPKPTDPKQAEQQKMMMFVFPLFGLLLYTMPSGLMLYFITSSLWGIAEQRFIKKKIAEREEKRMAERLTPAAAAAGRKKGKK